MSIRNAAVWSLAAQYATFVIQFAASVIISRLFLLPSDVGLFSIALAASMLVSIFQDMGITRFISGQPEMRPEAVPHYASVSVSIGWTVALAIAATSPFVASFYKEPALIHLLWLIAGSYLVMPYATVPAALLVKDMDFRALFKVNAGSAFAGNATAIALAASGFGAASLAWGVLATALARATIANLIHPVRPRMPSHLKTVKPMLGFSSMSFVLSASGAVGQRSQDLIVGRLLGLAATGLFSRASALAGQLTTLVTGAIGNVFYPAFARKRDAGEPLAAPYLHLVACYTALNWAAMTGLALCAEPLVMLLYGPNWIGAAPLLRWTALAEMFFVAIPLQMDIPLLLGQIKKLVWVNLLDTAAAVVILAIGCTIGLEQAAQSRLAYGLVWWSIYALYLSGIIGFRIDRLLMVYLRSAICALAAGLPLITAYSLGMRGAEMGLPVLLALCGLGVLSWLATLALTRHPAWAEVRGAVGAIAGPLFARSAG
ncbi:oligosaccharide flippase family protein [Novosphingobium mangrovi (ex Huang et al. 2023)]|uniref:Oligosaccharide flippase family protein n=1 Tax=Novosphingobium mangrovi (ex Huang et al. 2023) TaxID=2976432 RepID=A0ABT2I5P5_9SPHN|nr:oligosaccharide flippase family protein [Novosphingobium mangrovi (ex Huang et al. 2023)]MCT2400128.1 oligosaccharide flippase family protein [Novosphingobium mangrovi (ex Huang et al. 2023)]